MGEITMTGLSRYLIQSVAKRGGIDAEHIISPRRHKVCMRARIEVAKRLNEHGYTTEKIGRILHRDHTTIVFYLGRGKRRPSTEKLQRWRKPVVRHLRFLKVAKPSAPPPAERRLYLVPYAGAYMPEYQWKERRA